MHHIDVRRSELRMTESARDLANDTKSVTLPQTHRNRIRRHHTIELHRREACVASLLQRVLAHRRCHALATR